MFADDVTLLAANKAQLISMIRDVRDELGKHGLNLNMDKCLVQTSQPGAKVAPIKIEDQAIPMVCASEGFKVLGTQFTLTGRCSAEVRCRVSLWPLLGKRDGNLNERMRLFDSSVTQTALWCCESWLITQTEKRLLQTTQNAMLRRIAGPRRRPEEEWVDWIKRSTRKALGIARDCGIRFWHQAHLQSKWCWAGHVLRMDSDRLARRAAEWRDSRWQASELELPASLRIRRPARTRWFRWEDELRRYAAHQEWTSWQSMAQLRDSSGKAATWHEHMKGFIEYTRK